MNNILSASILGCKNKVEAINKLIDNKIKWIHYDVMDGLFVPNKSLSTNEIEYILSNTKKHIRDIHLMVNDPIKYINELKNYADYITFHYEAESIDNIKKILKKYEGLINIGISIKPKTNIEQIYEFIPYCTHILIMTVEPGKGGQIFDNSTLNKIVKLKKYLEKIKSKTFIQVDGGINNLTSKLVISAGATNIVSGSYLINNINNKNIINNLIK